MTATTLHRATFESPLGTLEIIGSEAGIVALKFLDAPPADAQPVPPALRQAVEQLGEYFAGTRTTFTLDLQLQGTAFEQRVYRELLAIPFGETRSYGEIAAALGDPLTVRAVGRANAGNPIAIVVPCHRVIGADGDLTGYAGGLWRKRWLLAHEGTPVQQPLF